MVEKWEGIYVFGGKNELGMKDNIMRKMIIGIPPVKWREFTVMFGPKPSARYSHTMTYFPEMEFIVIYGGRQDIIKGNQLYSPKGSMDPLR